MVGFAGARGLDDRRRRRLVQEAESAERRAPVKPTPPVVRSAPKFASSPIESVVRPQVWINVLMVVLGLTASGGAVFLGEWISRNHPPAERSFGLDGLLLRTLSAIYFLFGAQLAAAIQWYRTRSRKDFNGRYKVWHFVVPALLAFSVCAATDAHRVFAEWAQTRWLISGSHAATLLWMVPAGVVLLAMVRLLHTEMRGTSGAAPSLWIATLAASANAAVLLNAPVPIDDATVAIIGRSASLLWPLGLLLSLHFYARRVIYITNEPCALPAATTRSDDDAARNWLKWWRPRVQADRKAKSSETPAASTDRRASAKPAVAPQRTEAKNPPQDADEEQHQPFKPAAASATRTPPTLAAPMPAAPAMSARASVNTPISVPRAAAADAAAPATDNVVRRADSAHDDDDEEPDRDGGHHAMSKKDRKKLRKIQQREQRSDFD